MINDELKIIIGHKPCVYDTPPDWQMLTTDPNASGFYVEDDSIIKQENNHNVLSEHSYLIPLAKKLNSMPEIKTVRIMQYRKIVSNIILPAQFNSIMSLVLPKQIFKQWDFNQITAPIDSNNQLMLSDSLNLQGYKNILNQYSACHIREDILSFVVDSRRCGELSDVEADLFLNFPTFLIGGIGLGVYPTDLFIKVMKKIENVVNFHYKHGWKKRQDPYQSHNIAFCLERFSSFLLIRELQARNINYLNVTGSTVIISEDGLYDPLNQHHVS